MSRLRWMGGDARTAKSHTQRKRIHLSTMEGPLESDFTLK